MFPVFAGDGTHPHISGMAMTQSAPNRENALTLMEVLPGTGPSALVRPRGSFTADSLGLAEIATRRAAALMIERVDFDGRAWHACPGRIAPGQAMSKSIARVEAAARAAGIGIEVRRMGASTRTAAEAAEACGCTVGQIVKSLIFRGPDGLALFLVPGDARLDPARAEAVAGAALERADPDEVRRVTGFAIGGVAPIGHLAPLPVWMDERLLAHDTLWAAAGAPDAVFRTDPATLLRLTGATPARLSA